MIEPAALCFALTESMVELTALDSTTQSATSGQPPLGSHLWANSTLLQEDAVFASIDSRHIGLFSESNPTKRIGTILSPLANERKSDKALKAMRSYSSVKERPTELDALAKLHLPMQHSANYAPTASLAAYMTSSEISLSPRSRANFSVFRFTLPRTKPGTLLSSA